MSSHKEPNSVGIIGAQGQFGSWFSRLFAARGQTVVAVDVGSQVSVKQLVERVDAIVLAVPLGVTEVVLSQLIPLMRRGQLLVELTSVKTPFEPLITALPCEVLSLHPMFSPSLPSLRGQSCIDCSANQGGALANYFRSLLEEEGLSFVSMTPDEHDRTMAIVQGLTHFQAIVAGHCMVEAGFDPTQSLAVASPIYRMRLAMVGRILAQNARLYAEIQIFNPYVRDVLTALEKSSQVFSQAIAERDVERFVTEFERARSGLKGFEQVAIEESNRVIQALASKE